MAVLAIVAMASTAYAADIQAVAEIDRDRVYVGEAFSLTITVDGASAAEQPDLSGLTDFSVQYVGGSQNNSQNIVINNGRITRDERRGYVMSYLLTPNKEGELQIPALTVVSDGKEYVTNPITVTALAPEENKEYKAAQTLSKAKCYVGEPILLRVKWYFTSPNGIRGFTLPIADDKRFAIVDISKPSDKSENLFRLQVPTGDLIVEKSAITLDGIAYTTLGFSKVVFPKEPGNFTIPATTVAFEVQDQARRPGYDPFFSRGRTRTVVAKSDPLNLEVLPLPEENRPANFNGLVGSYTISTEATPTEMNVGDPITLTMRVQGVPYFDHVELPSLEHQTELAKNFRIPDEMAPGESTPDGKVFRQTIRPNTADVTQIPPIALAYFDSNAGEYRIAESAPIPITVNETRMVTSADVEGAPIVPAEEEADTLEVSAQGIAYNYEGADLLEPQQLTIDSWRNGWWWPLMVAPPAIFAAALIMLLVQRGARSNSNSAAAYPEWQTASAKLRGNLGNPAFHGALLDALRAYLGAKLNASGKSMTHSDAAALLNQRDVSPAAVKQMTTVFEACEAAHYAKTTSAPEDNAALLDRADEAVRAVEKGLQP